MEEVGLVGVDRDFHDHINDVLWHCLLEFMNIPLMIVPKPVDRDVKVALGSNQVCKSAFRVPPIMPEGYSSISQAPEYVSLCVCPNSAYSFPNTRISSEEFGDRRTISLAIFANGESRLEGVVEPQFPPEFI
ncbi:UNVERIFIED_CONTAM: hypothetical protein Slati_2644200 [Sesamum latifolium]|uniref:Uncharacterized protein n=1 Tax=Sesamum latifolium TaxID=2727402 RepID=A0AAW2VTV0_9LAMI